VADPEPEQPGDHVENINIIFIGHVGKQDFYGVNYRIQNFETSTQPMQPFTYCDKYFVTLKSNEKLSCVIV